MKKLFKLGFLSLLLSSLIVMSGCYKSDIDSLEKDIDELRNNLKSNVETIDGKLATLQAATTDLQTASAAQQTKITEILASIATQTGRIDILQTTVTNQGTLISAQGTKITNLETDLGLTKTDLANTKIALAALELAMAVADAQTLSDAKEYADGLCNALQAQLNPINTFLKLNGAGALVIDEEAPNDLLNGTYESVYAFVNGALNMHISILKGEMEAIAERVAVLEDALGSKGDMWGETDTAWEAIGKNYGEIQTLKSRLDNVAGLDISLEEYVENVNQFKADTEAHLAELEGRFAGWDQLEEGVTIIDYIAASIYFAIGDLEGGEWDIQGLKGFAGNQYSTVTEMVNGEIGKLKEYMLVQIAELKGYTDEQIAALLGFTKDELADLKQFAIDEIEASEGRLMILLADLERYTDEQIAIAMGYTTEEIRLLKEFTINAIALSDQYTDDQIASLKSFTLCKIAKSELKSKGYTDAEIEKLRDALLAEIAELRDFTEQEILDLSNYTKGEFILIRQSIIDAIEESKGYTNDEIAKLEKFTIDELADLELRANGYTDDEIAKLSIVLKKYTDDGIADLKEFTIGELAELEVRAQAYTDAEIADLHKHLHKYIGKEIKALDKKLTNDIATAISDLNTELRQFISEEIEDLYEYINGQIGEVLKKMQDMVTGIAVMKGKDGAIVYDDVLKYPVVTQVVDNVFGPAEELQFVAGNIFMANGPHEQSMLIKVTPDNAVLTAATQFVLFDTEKKDYLASGAYSITVAPYAGGVLTRSDVENHGLWVVTLRMEDQDELPTQGALLSFGIKNDLRVVPEGDPNRVVSTGPVVEVVTSVAPYTPAYYYYRGLISGGVNPVYNVKIGTGSATDIDNFTNSGNSLWWNTTPPSVNASTAAFSPGTASNGDNRPIGVSLSTPAGNRSLRLANVGDDISVAPKATVPNGLLAWYVDFKSAIPSLTTVADWGHINVMRTTEVAFENKQVSDIATPAVIKVPANNALHREVVEFNVMGVNIDGTMVDPDGVPFRVGIVAPNYTAPTTQLTVMLENYPKSTPIGTVTVDTDEVEFSVAALGFTEEFMSGLTTTYSVTFALTPALTQTDNTYGQMEVKINDAWEAVTAGTDWKEVTHIRFTNVDPCAMASGVTYTGNLVLTETVATTAPGVESNPPYVTATQAPAIKLTFPISIKLAGNMPFGTDMMNYKTGMASNNNIVIWPSVTGTYGLGDAFQYLGTTLAADVTFTPEDADLTVTATPHILTIANVVNHLSTPTDTHKCNVLATYAYGPVFGTAYGNGYFQQPWEGGVDGVFTVEARNRMDWVTYDDSDISTGLPTAVTTLDASKFRFIPLATSGMGTESFTLKQAIASKWVLATNDATNPATIKTVAEDGTINKYFDIRFSPAGDIEIVSTGSTSVTEEIELELNFTIYDQFGQAHSYTRTLTLLP